MSGLTYKKAGVDIKEGDRFVGLIAPLARKTFRPEVMTGIGSFSGLFKLDVAKYKEPVLVSGTDGVGTKLKVAFMADRHSTVGIDLVAMCVNDILTSGAEPLFFLDYFATGKLKAEKAKEVIEGIIEGCNEAGCSLIGGETAEMPGFYADGEYDLAGFAVGVVEKSKIIEPCRVRAGDALIGIASTGLHSNGYSLARKVFFDKAGMRPEDYVPALGTTIAEELLKPTRIYVKAYNSLVSAGIEINGIAHITGGGIPGNLPRAFPEGVSADIISGSWPEPPVFGLLREMGDVPEDEMRWTFNMGIGYIIIVPAGSADNAVSVLRENGYESYLIGEVKKGGRGARYV
ncbi:MAG: phosphoribosylformylglycinamidine cyclo-ligase [Thermodesulfovibrionales bacterium]|nr:phosphoribosylformylglycinamidine cyclo-ligase [Thermodesulfovibrionales bacterium]